MKEQKDILDQAIARRKEASNAAQPPKWVIDQTVKRLAEAQAQSTYEAPRRTMPLAPLRKPSGRWIAAAAVLVIAAYALGRLTAPTPDLDELRAELLPALAASLEPTIRSSVVEETTRNCEQALVAAYVRIKDELTEQYRADLNRFAVQTFAASNTVTNNLLEQLVESVKASQRRDRQWFASALEQLEAQRAEDSAALGTALVNLATHTETKLQRTKEDMVRLLAHTQNESETTDQGSRPH